MGKNIISQARGKGGPTYRAPSFRYKGKARHKSLRNEDIGGKVVDFVHCQGHSAPLMIVAYDDEELALSPAPEGIALGDNVSVGKEIEIKVGNTLPLSEIPAGVTVYNIEQNPGDGGKFVRSSGCGAKIVSKTGNKVTIEMPSKKQKVLNNQCRATIGVLAGGGRLEKPLLKAGKSYYKHKVKNKLWPKVSGASMNAVDHPFGNKRSSRKSKSRPISSNAPPGRKVGQVGARKTGQKKGNSLR